MAIDSYFTIGKAHSTSGVPCQDYAFHGETFGVIADGCSSSTGRPDLGARLAAGALADFLAAPLRGDPQLLVITALRKFIDSGIATREDLLTTVGGFVRSREGIQAWLWGDGVVFAEFTDGTRETLVVSSENNTPKYPVYLLDRVAPTVQSGIEDKPCEHSLPHYWDFRGRRVRNFMMATDGLAQFLDAPVERVIEEMIAFKTTSGAFVKRRALRALKALTPIDDVALVISHEDLC